MGRKEHPGPRRGSEEEVLAHEKTLNPFDHEGGISIFYSIQHLALALKESSEHSLEGSEVGDKNLLL